MIRYSDSCVVVWKIAELEARNLKTSEIEPTHLFLALCKVVDVDLASLIPDEMADRSHLIAELSREAATLRKVMADAGLKPKQFRRMLREQCHGSTDEELPDGRLHRSKQTRGVFSLAEKASLLTGAVVYPIHLLSAVLRVSDATLDGLATQLGVDLAKLLSLAKEEVSPNKKLVGGSSRRELFGKN